MKTFLCFGKFLGVIAGAAILTGCSESESIHEPQEISYGSLFDNRDGQTYKTVQIGDQIWMAENLNYVTDNSFCYDDDLTYCQIYGRLYTWAAAMDSSGIFSASGSNCGKGNTCSSLYPTRGICPQGWHLPTYGEFKTLLLTTGEMADEPTAYYATYTPFLRSLRSTSGWRSSVSSSDHGPNGTNASGFNALPAGERLDYLWMEETYYVKTTLLDGSFTVFWSASEIDGSFAYVLHLPDSWDGESNLLTDWRKSVALSVRSISDF